MPMLLGSRAPEDDKLLANEDEDEGEVDVENAVSRNEEGYIDLIPPLKSKRSSWTGLRIGVLIGLLLLVVLLTATLTTHKKAGNDDNPVEKNTPFALSCDALVGPYRGSTAELPADKETLQSWCSQTLSCINEHTATIHRASTNSADSAFRKFVLGHLNQIDMLMDNVFGITGLLQSVHPDTAMVDAASECRLQASDANAALLLNTDIYAVIRSLNESTPTSDSTWRYLQATANGMRASGIERSATIRDSIRRLSTQESVLATNFSQNIARSTKYVIVPPGKAWMLSGLNSSFVTARTNSTGHTIFSTDYTDYIPIMHTASSESLRRQMYRAFNRRAYPENANILKSLLQRRFEKARLLGYDNYAEFSTAGKMVQNATTVVNFLQQVQADVTTIAQAEIRALNTSDAANGLDVYEPYNYAYASIRYMNDNFAVNETEVNSYFSTQAVRDGIFYVAGRLFNLEFRRITTVPVWHADIAVYDVIGRVNETSDMRRQIGRVYLDLYPRNGKFKHAAMFSIRRGLAGVQVPEAALVCNFPHAPTRMTFNDVQTFFHEFGHLIHHIIGGQNQRWVAFSGIATEWDFVEAPSQLFERWPNNIEALAHFARNDDGNVIPTELVTKMQTAAAFGRGVRTQQQLFYAWSALLLHQYDTPTSIALGNMEKMLTTQFSPFNYVSYSHMYASFGHLTGYGPLYYTYQWSLSIADDLFYSKFCPRKMFDTNVASEYAHSILQPGGKRAAADLLESFLGRPWNTSAHEMFLRGDLSSTCARHFTMGAHV